MISKVTIKGFKGLNNLEISNLSRINLLGGCNNVGKTSILEALFMFHDRFNPHMILRQFSWRGVDEVTFDPNSICAPIFFDFNLKNKISITATIDGNEEEMNIIFNPSYKNVIPAEEIKSGELIKIKTNQKISKLYSLDITYLKDNKEKKSSLSIGLDGINMHIDSLEGGYSATFLGARTPRNLLEDAQKFGQLDISGNQEEVVDFLKIIEPKLTSLSSVAIGQTSLIHGDIGLSRKIPIPYMGDGISRLLSIILSIANLKNGILFIDEFENGLHYKVMPKIWEAVASAAKKYNCQIISTTHSYDCIKSAYLGIPKNLIEEFSYIRIDKDVNEIKAKHFDHNALKIVLDENMEIR